jgi:hypothetical protein
MAPSVAPSALRIAISFDFSAIISKSVLTMQKLATMISIDRMRNVAILSSLSALKRYYFISRQSRTRSSGRPTAAVTAGVSRSAFSASSTLT